MPDLSSAVTAAGAYLGSGALQTLIERAIWIVNNSEPAHLIYGVA
jgi:hypothetical protein